MNLGKHAKKNIANVLAFLPDKPYIRLRYYFTFHKRIDLKNPQTYNEKIQWMKLYDHDERYHQLVDKWEVRQYVADRIGDDYNIPVIGVWDSFDDIDFSSLPDQFVLKCTHDSGSVFICRNKSEINYKELKKHFDFFMKRNQYKAGREWVYKGLKPRIIAEQLMVDDSGNGLKDYKFFCFDGKVKAMFIATDRGVEGEDVKFDFFDDQFNHLPFTHGHENASVTPEKPATFEEMKLLAEKLSKGLRAVRVDLYETDERVYFGELTFYHHCGFVPFVPEQWDHTFGSWISLQ